jgi:hypothetical protein
MRHALARKIFSCATTTCAVLAITAAKADDCGDTGKTFAMYRMIYDDCPGWRLTESGLRRFVEIGNKLEQTDGERCHKIGSALMYRSLMEMNPEIKKLAEAKDLPRFSKAVCETLALRFEMMSAMAGREALVEKGPARKKQP